MCVYRKKQRQSLHNNQGKNSAHVTILCVSNIVAQKLYNKHHQKSGNYKLNIRLNKTFNIPLPSTDISSKKAKRNIKVKLHYRQNELKTLIEYFIQLLKNIHSFHQLMEASVGQVIYQTINKFKNSKKPQCYAFLLHWDKSKTTRLIIESMQIHKD